MSREDILRLGKPTVLSFTGKSKEDFVSLTKDKQIEYVSERLSPKGDTDRAKQLLKDVKHKSDKQLQAKPTEEK